MSKIICVDDISYDDRYRIKTELYNKIGWTVSNKVPTVAKKEYLKLGEADNFICIQTV
jgi:hypothetical protein